MKDTILDFPKVFTRLPYGVPERFAQHGIAYTQKGVNKFLKMGFLEYPRYNEEYKNLTTLERKSIKWFWVEGESFERLWVEMPCERRHSMSAEEIDMVFAKYKKYRNVQL